MLCGGSEMERYGSSDIARFEEEASEDATLRARFLPEITGVAGDDFGEFSTETAGEGRLSI